MKKTGSLFLVIACLSLVLSIPAFAGESADSQVAAHYDNTRMGDTVRGNATNMPATNYRAAATNEADRDFDWGWLGLIGLAGLAGLRNRDRERT